VLLQAYDLVAPTQVDRGDLPGTLDERAFQQILLEIDEGRHLVPAFRQQVERIGEIVANEHLAELPGHAHGNEAFA
jgi:hypothetical protein